MHKTILLFLLLSAAMWTAVGYFDLAISPEKSTQLALANLNGGDAQANQVRLFSAAQDSLTFICFITQVVATTILFVALIARIRIRMLLNRSLPKLQG